MNEYHMALCLYTTTNVFKNPRYDFQKSRVGLRCLFATTEVVSVALVDAEFIVFGVGAGCWFDLDVPDAVLFATVDILPMLLTLPTSAIEDA